MRYVSAILSALLLLGAQSASAQEREWTLDAAGDDAFLVFGVPQSDDVGLSFWCKISSGEMQIFAPVPHKSGLKDGEKTTVVIEINGSKFAVDGRANFNYEASQNNVEVALKTGDPLLPTLSNADRVSIEVANHRTTFPLLNADFAGLLKLCGSK